MEDRRILQGKLMSTHTKILNEISEIKAKNIELSDEDKIKVKKLEQQLKLVAESLYKLYL
jgi:hypothetical protein